MQDQVGAEEVLSESGMARKADWVAGVTDLDVLTGPVRGGMMKEKTGEIQASGRAAAEGAGRASPQSAGQEAAVIPELSGMSCVKIQNVVNRSGSRS